MKIRILITVVLIAVGLAQAGVGTETSTAEGYGESYLEAIDNALVSAAQQVRGAEITIARIPYKIFASQAEANMMLGMGTASQQAVMVDGSASIYLKRFQGYVKSYSVTDSQQLSEKSWRVTIKAEVYTNTETDLGEVTRDTIAVLPLHINSSSIKFFDKSLSASELADGIAAELDVLFTKSNKLDVVDRKYISDLNREKNLVTSGSENQKQKVLLGLLAGADYVLTGTIRDFRVGDVSRGSETLGFQNTRYEAKVTIDLRIIAVGTSKTICADTLDLWLKHSDILAQRRDTNDYGKLDTKDQLLIISRLLAQRISDKTIEDIFPTVVAAIIDDAVIVTGGSVNINVGDRYTIDAGSRIITDPETGEVLGKFGGDKIVIEIREVNDKMSVATAISGDIDKVKTGDICRIVEPEQKELKTGSKGIIQPDSSGRIYLPGDPR